MLHKGIAGADGIAIGEVYVYRQENVVIDRSPVPLDRIAGEIQQLHQGANITREQLLKVRQIAFLEMGEDRAQIFDAHIAFVEDQAFIGEITDCINDQHLTAVFAVETVVCQYETLFASLEDEYMRERASDIRDVGNRLIRNLLGFATHGVEYLTKEVIIFARELTPSDMLTLNKKWIKGLVTDIGGRTSHAAIIARTMEIPAVLGLGNISEEVRDGEFIIVDGTDGIIIRQPKPEQVSEYRRKQAENMAGIAELSKLFFLPAVTIDGRRVEIAANIGMPQDVDAVLRNGGEGVGLYRTEFLYLERDQFPSEEEQFAAYKSVADALEGKPVIIRTLDIGGDKELKCLALPREMNPFLGWRAIRICLSLRELFKTQLRAMLRASAHGNVRIMYPMISGIQEVREANAILEEVKQELRCQGTAFDEHIRVGIMVEVPAAALTAETLIKEVDFFSIGTNDLCQYTLAVDRMNEKIAHLYQPLHPAVLRLIKQVIDVSHRHGKLTGMCGELAGDPMATLILLGLGLDEFSMSASSMLQVKKVIRSLSYQEAKKVAETALCLETAEDIAALSARYFPKDKEDI